MGLECACGKTIETWSEFKEHLVRGHTVSIRGEYITMKEIEKTLKQLRGWRPIDEFK